MISVSRTKLPKLKDYSKMLEPVWEKNWLTNDGDLVRKLEKKLAEYWGVKHVVCVDHGTSALTIAAKSLGIDEVNISPFTYVGTVTAMLWVGIKVNFYDSDEKPKSPVLSTHVYGVPQLVEGSPVIYDASHAFAVKVDGKSILSYGDVSAISFHAVKIFQTVEGGAVVTNRDDIAEKARRMRNFGIVDRYSFDGVGINCKMSEFHAAMGLCSFKQLPKTVKKYAKIIDKYNKAFNQDFKDVTYYPVWYDSETKLLRALEYFAIEDIYPRRYFYPPLNKVFGGKSCPKAEDLMSRVMCLPLYYDLTSKQVDKIIQITKATQ